VIKVNTTSISRAKVGFVKNKKAMKIMLLMFISIGIPKKESNL